MTNTTNNFLDDLDFFSLRRFFYAVLPSEIAYEKVEQVPDFYTKAAPWVLVLIGLEFIILKLTRKDGAEFNDTITSFCSGQMNVFSKFSVFSLRGGGIILYTYIYENYRLVDLPFDGRWTFFIAFITQDLAYYFWHRATHELGWLWSVHQIHHSSEYFNLATAQRRSPLQEFVALTFESPQALWLSPATYVAHRYLNILYQFWVHTELVPKLGPLEYIFNTPSHHRVHHGRNPYCIDKNYAGTLIIWDKIFGTFAEERPDEEIAFGLVKPVNTFDQMYLQMFDLKQLLYDKPFKWLPKSASLSVRLKCYIYPTGWFPGTKLKWFIWWRKADTEENIPKIRYPITKYNPLLPSWLFVYVIVLFLVHMSTYIKFLEVLSVHQLTIVIGYLVWTMQSIGYLLDDRSWKYTFELIRNLTVFTILVLTDAFVENPVFSTITSANMVVMLVALLHGEQHK